MTVKELKEKLNQFDENLPIQFVNNIVVSCEMGFTANDSDILSMKEHTEYSYERYHLDDEGEEVDEGGEVINVGHCLVIELDGEENDKRDWL